MGLFMLRILTLILVIVCHAGFAKDEGRFSSSTMRKVRQARRLNEKSKDAGLTFLQEAIKEENQELVKALLANGIKPNAENDQRMDFFRSVINGGDSGVLNAFLWKFRLSIEDANELLHQAVEQNQPAMISPLIVEGANIDSFKLETTYEAWGVLGAGSQTKQNRELTPLLIAIEVGNIDMVRTLLENGADPNISGTRKRETVLVSGTTSKDVFSEESECPLDNASEEPKIVELLKQYGAETCPSF